MTVLAEAVILAAGSDPADLRNDQVETSATLKQFLAITYVYSM
jgi:hypothetical protein